MATEKILQNGTHVRRVRFHPARRPLPLSPAIWLRRFKRTGKHNEIFLAIEFGLGHGEPGRVMKADPEYVREVVNKPLSSWESITSTSTTSTLQTPRSPSRSGQVSMVCLVIHKPEPSSSLERERSDTSGPS